MHQQDCNEGVLQQLLAFAADENLDWQGEIKGVGPRHVIDPGDQEARPPIAPIFEGNKDYRRRIQLAPEGYSSAGPIGAYIYHALRADPRIKDAFAYENGEAEVVVPILSREGNGDASNELIAVITDALNADTMRPSNDQPVVVSASILNFSIDGTLYFYNGPDREVAFAQALERLTEFVKSRHRLGDDIPLSGVYAALHIPGVVSKVELREPNQDIVVARDQAAYCDPDTAITLINGGVND